MVVLTKNGSAPISDLRCSYCTIQTYPILLFCGREGIKSVMTDLSYLMSSNSNNQTTNVENEQSVNNVNSSSVTRDLIAHDRRRSGFRRRGDTTTIEGPTGAPQGR